MADDEQVRKLARLNREYLDAFFAGDFEAAEIFRYRIDCLERGRPDPGEQAEP